MAAAHGFDLGKNAEKQSIPVFFKKNLGRTLAQTARREDATGADGPVRIRGISEGDAQARPGLFRVEILPVHKGKAVERQFKQPTHGGFPFRGQLDKAISPEKRFRKGCPPRFRAPEEIDGKHLNGIQNDDGGTGLHERNGPPRQRFIRKHTHQPSPRTDDALLGHVMSTFCFMSSSFKNSCLWCRARVTLA